MRRMPFGPTAALVFAGLAVLVAGCSPIEDTIKPMDLDWYLNWNRMLVQPKVKAYQRSDFYDDGIAMRTPPMGAVRWSGQVPVHPDPPKVTRALLERGRDRFEVTCGACHGVDGYSTTVVASKMTLRPPPSLHEERIRNLSDRKIFQVVTEGYGLMPSYRAQLDFRDRWAVVHYVRALQLSQHAPVAELPAPVRRRLDEEVP